jgi:hypothetical protein
MKRNLCQNNPELCKRNGKKDENRRNTGSYAESKKRQREMK